MKNWKYCAFIGMVAIIVFSFVFVGCKPEPDPEIQRTFTITVDGKDITVKDTRTGKNDQTLEDLGILETLTTRLSTSPKDADGFKEAVARPGFAIYVEDTTAYEYHKAYNENKLGLRLSFLLENPDTTSARLRIAFVAMGDGKPYPTQN